MLQELGRRKMATTTQINILGNVGYDVYYLLLLVKFQSFLREVTKANGFAYVETPTVGLYLARSSKCCLARYSPTVGVST